MICLKWILSVFWQLKHSNNLPHIPLHWWEEFIVAQQISRYFGHQKLIDPLLILSVKYFGKIDALMKIFCRLRSHFRNISFQRKIRRTHNLKIDRIKTNTGFVSLRTRVSSTRCLYFTRTRVLYFLVCVGFHKKRTEKKNTSVRE